jgi:hypothetical protein
MIGYLIKRLLYKRLYKFNKRLVTSMFYVLSTVFGVASLALVEIISFGEDFSMDNMAQEHGENLC